VLVATGFITLSIFGGYIAAWVLGMPQLIFAISVISAKDLGLLDGRHVRRWILYIAMIVACMKFDLEFGYEYYPSLAKAITEPDWWYWDEIVVIPLR
jgi:hypothetical protein